MNGLIDFDDPNTFPKILNEWGAEFEHMDAAEWYPIL